jgi:tetratricopeptide (TPR) repeat protein
MGTLQGGPNSINRGDAAAALEYHRKALAICEEIAAADPASGSARQDLAICYERMGSALLSDDPKQSAEFHGRALTLAAELLESSPDEFRFMRLRVTNLRKLAKALAAGDDLPRAVELLHEALDVLHAQKEQYPSNKELEPDLHSTYLALADTLLASGRDDEALVRYREALQIAEAAWLAVPSDLLALWRHATILRTPRQFLCGARCGARQRTTRQLARGTGLV